MKTYNVVTWDEVKNAFQLIEQDRISLAKKHNLQPSSSNTLFRGHSNSEWDLKTTLESWN
jgi:hypothetical protein